MGAAPEASSPICSWGAAPRADTGLAGWRKMTAASRSVIGRPNRQAALPSLRWEFAHAANSAGVGAWPSATVQRRTMNPSIIFGNAGVDMGEICRRFRRAGQGFAGTSARSCFNKAAACCLVCSNRSASQPSCGWGSNVRASSKV